MSLKRTALFAEHQKAGGKLIDFGGWELPVQYSGIIDEHLACRTACGLFDVSHMGEIHVEGADAANYLNTLVTNQVSKLALGQAQYTAMCHESGGIVDDLVIYRRAHDRFLVVVNASNTTKDFEHMLNIWKLNATSFKCLTITNESAQYTQIALQGRKAVSILEKITSAPLENIKTYWFFEGEIFNQPAIIARTGYTGEDGFELYVPWNHGPQVWNALMEIGTPLGLKPCGLGARDTLRMEMKYPLYGHELSDTTLPLETGLGWVVKMEKENFVGHHALAQAKLQGLKKTLVGLKLLERGIPRQGYEILSEQGTSIGIITSGTQSPSLGQAIGIASIDLNHSQVGSRVLIQIRNTQVPAEIIPTPFYKRNY